MAEALAPDMTTFPYSSCNIGWVGHSQVGWQSLNDQYQPIPDAHITLYRKPGALASKFFEYPELTQALRDNLDLVILWMGGNDINPATSPRVILDDLRHIITEFNRVRTSVIIMTIEARKYMEGSRHYVAPQLYNKMKNAINRRLQKDYAGRVILTGGLTVNESHLNMDGVHLDHVGRGNIERKIIGAVNNFMLGWREEKNHPLMFPTNFPVNI